jgi:hypothetical protein
VRSAGRGADDSRRRAAPARRIDNGCNQFAGLSVDAAFATATDVDDDLRVAVTSCVKRTRDDGVERFAWVSTRPRPERGGGPG